MSHVHLIGIGGFGMSAIARVLLESGYTVSGSDRQMSSLARDLQSSGVRVSAGHDPQNVQGADLVVRSSAIPDSNPELQAAVAAGIPVFKRSDFLGRLMEGRQGIAVAGSHGKTTTTAMIAWVLSALGQDPSFIIGGVSANLGTNARAGRGPSFVIEADEYDRTFLGLRPELAVVTNVEHDHPDCYPTGEDFYQAFREFVRCITPGGSLLACSDDPGARRLLADAAAEGLRTFAYGLERWLGHPCPDYCAVDLQPNSRGSFDFVFVSGDPRLLGAGQERIRVELQVPGMHNVRNAVAALAAAALLGLPLVDAAQALGQFEGTGRRFEIRGEAGGVTVIDDYAHHPTEIRATLSAARTRYPHRSIWAVWQPHTYSRARTLLKDFITSFEDADHVLVTEVYAAREPVAADFSSRQVVESMQHPDARHIPGLAEAREYLIQALQPGDVLLVLSAGDADQVSAEVFTALHARNQQKAAQEAKGN